MKNGLGRNSGYSSNHWFHDSNSWKRSFQQIRIKNSRNNYSSSASLFIFYLEEKGMRIQSSLLVTGTISNCRVCVWKPDTSRRIQVYYVWNLTWCQMEIKEDKSSLNFIKIVETLYLGPAILIQMQLRQAVICLFKVEWPWKTWWRLQISDLFSYIEWNNGNNRTLMLYKLPCS